MRTWAHWSARERAEVVRQHAMPRVSVTPGMAVADLANLFQVSETEIRAILKGADFPETDPERLSKDAAAGEGDTEER